MAIDKEDDIAKLAESLGGVIAPASMIDDPKSMLKAIQNAALIRTGIGIMGQRRMGESGYDVAGRVIGDVAKSSAEQLQTYAKLAAAKTGDKKSKGLRQAAKDYSQIRKNLYYEPDPETGTLTQRRMDLFQSENFGSVPLPSEELFKDVLGPIYEQEGGGELLQKIHEKHKQYFEEVKKLYPKADWTFDDTIERLRKKNMMGG